MILLLKSKLLREQIKHWAALVALCAWALTATVWGWSRKEKIIVIAVETSGTRLVADDKDKILEVELTNFLKHFLETFYQYDSSTFEVQAGRATDLMSEDLWREKNSEIIQIANNLKGQNLTQNIEIQSIDKIAENQYEALLAVSIKSRMQTHQVKLKVQVRLEPKKRDSTNPYSYEIGELHESQM